MAKSEKWVVLAVCDQPDTRVDMGSELKEVVAILGHSPDKGEVKKLLAKWVKDNGDGVAAASDEWEGVVVKAPFIS